MEKPYPPFEVPKPTFKKIIIHEEMSFECHHEILLSDIPKEATRLILKTKESDYGSEGTIFFASEVDVSEGERELIEKRYKKALIKYNNDYKKYQENLIKYQKYLDEAKDLMENAEKKMYLKLKKKYEKSSD